ncbi:hypothetical protein DERF_009786 [Dermatophagoides farinae]|uniref:Uncharacterized protein n=1 Tax=Dermatophagoides farinae TaxID=6954 RepID=A0A922HXB6_DERFA|nr:hypothetical protein DERF_009786 [Dermatophagoides farinae]
MAIKYKISAIGSTSSRQNTLRIAQEFKSKAVYRWHDYNIYKMKVMIVPVVITWDGLVTKIRPKTQYMTWLDHNRFSWNSILATILTSAMVSTDDIDQMMEAIGDK